MSYDNINNLITPSNHEIDAESTVLREQVIAATSENAFASEISDIDAQIVGSERLLRQVVDRDVSERLSDEARQSDDFRVVNEVLDRKRRYDKEAYKRDPEASSKFAQLDGRRTELSEWGRKNIQSDSDDGRAILASLGRIVDAQKLHPDAGDAPFAQYHANTDEVWQHAPEEKVKEYLESRLFFNTGTSIREYPKRTLNIYASRNPDYSEGTIQVPTELFVNLAGFDSWLGRGGEHSSKSYGSEYGWQVGSSLDAMRHYASLNSDLPEVYCTRIFMQPNGLVFADNASGDSHRVGAAILRGQETVATKSLQLIPLTRNYIELPE